MPLYIQEVKLCYHNWFQPVLSYSLHSGYEKLSFSFHSLPYFLSSIYFDGNISVLKDTHFLEIKDQTLN